MTSHALFQPVPSDYPNRLACPDCQLAPLSRSTGLLIALVVLALVPRGLMVLRIPSINPDGVLYVQLAKALEAGDLRTGFGDMSLNVYPVILAGLHRLGLEWEQAAALWGVIVSSLVVLPLWGWVRRQFDDRVALVACLLYIVHTKFIEWSPEVMRDPTFWLLFMLAIYWLWRAVTEIRYGYFLAGGAAIVLASLTRIEGIFLLIPLTLWTFWRCLALTPLLRKRLVFGAILCVVAFPLLLALVNAVWLYGHTGWVGIRLSPLARVQPWLESIMGGATSTGSNEFDPPMRLGRMIWVFIPTMTRGLGPAFALLMFGGIWGWRHIWSRRDHQALFCTAVVVMCGIWVQLWYDKYICPRYALPIVLMASPWAALGMLGLMARLARVADWLQWSRRSKHALLAAAVTAVAVFGVADAMTSNTTYFEMRRMSADLGRWVQREFSTPPMLVGPVGIAPIASYYAQNSPYRAFRWEADDAAILAMAEECRAGVVLLRPTKQLTVERCEILVDRMKRFGLEPVDPAALPSTSGDVYVLVRSDKNRHMARVPLSSK